MDGGFKLAVCLLVVHLGRFARKMLFPKLAS